MSWRERFDDLWLPVSVLLLLLALIGALIGDMVGGHRDLRAVTIVDRWYQPAYTTTRLWYDHEHHAHVTTDRHPESWGVIVDDRRMTRSVRTGRELWACATKPGAVWTASFTVGRWTGAEYGETLTPYAPGAEAAP